MSLRWAIHQPFDRAADRVTAGTAVLRAEIQGRAASRARKQSRTVPAASSLDSDRQIPFDQAVAAYPADAPCRGNRLVLGVSRKPYSVLTDSKIAFISLPGLTKIRYVAADLLTALEPGDGSSPSPAVGTGALPPGEQGEMLAQLSERPSPSRHTPTALTKPKGQYLRLLADIEATYSLRTVD